MISNIKKAIRFKLLAISCVLFTITFAAHSQMGVIPLDSVLATIRQKNPMLKSYSSRADAMNTYATGARSWKAPEVGGGLWMIPYKKVEDPRDQGQIMLSIQQKITSPGKLKANQHYLQSKASIEQANESYVFNELKGQAKMAYYQWVVLEKKKNVLKENEDILNLMLKIAQLRYPYNQSKLGNIYKAEGRLHEIKNMMLMNDNEIHHRMTLLNQLMNRPLHTVFSPDTLHTVPSFQPLDIDSSLFVSSRSDIRRIDKSIQAMKLNQTLESYQSKPDFNLSFNHMIPRGIDMPSQFMLLGMISIPLAPWSSKMYKSNIQGMDKEIEAMKSERAAILSELQGMTSAMVSEISTLSRQIDNYEKRIIPSLRKNYETLMLTYEENKEDLPIVIDAWETLNMTQMQYYDTIQKYYEMIVNYEKQLEK